jgi:hypothetical protein
MIETPHIVQTEHVLAAVIKLTTPREEIRNVMEPTLNELRAPVMDQGVKITGPWFTHHSRPKGLRSRNRRSGSLAGFRPWPREDE